MGESGAAWWAWAWALPQATAWDAGSLYVVARRATLEDDLEVLENVGDLADVVGVDDDEGLRQLEWMFGRLKGIVSGRNGVMKEMRELDNRLGLNPKAMVDLRWSIASDGEVVEMPKPERKRSLRAIEG